MPGIMTSTIIWRAAMSGITSTLLQEGAVAVMARPTVMPGIIMPILLLLLPPPREGAVAMARPNCTSRERWHENSKGGGKSSFDFNVNSSSSRMGLLLLRRRRRNDDEKAAGRRKGCSIIITEGESGERVVVDGGIRGGKL